MSSGGFAARAQGAGDRNANTQASGRLSPPGANNPGAHSHQGGKK